MKSVRLCIFLLVLSWTVIAQGHGETFYLVLSDENGQKLASLPFEAGELFCLDFVNSIYQAPVRETFVYEPGKGLFLIQVESPSGGVFEYYGLESDSSGVARLHRKLGPIKILSSDYGHHRITVGKNTLALKGLIRNGEPLTLEIRSASPSVVRKSSGKVD